MIPGCGLWINNRSIDSLVARCGKQNLVTRRQKFFRTEIAIFRKMRRKSRRYFSGKLQRSVFARIWKSNQSSQLFLCARWVRSINYNIFMHVLWPRIMVVNDLGIFEQKEKYSCIGVRNGRDRPHICHEFLTYLLWHYEKIFFKDWWNYRSSELIKVVIYFCNENNNDKHLKMISELGNFVKEHLMSISKLRLKSVSGFPIQLSFGLPCCLIWNSVSVSVRFFANHVDIKSNSNSKIQTLKPFCFHIL